MSCVHVTTLYTKTLCWLPHVVTAVMWHDVRGSYALLQHKAGYYRTLSVCAIPPGHWSTALSISILWQDIGHIMSCQLPVTTADQCFWKITWSRRLQVYFQNKNCLFSITNPQGVWPWTKTSPHIWMGVWCTQWRRSRIRVEKWVWSYNLKDHKQVVYRKPITCQTWTQTFSTCAYWCSIESSVQSGNLVLIKTQW